MEETAGSYYVCEVDGILYGISSSSVRSFARIGLETISCFPGLPAHIRGLAAIGHSRMVGVVDLRQRLGKPEVLPTAKSRIVVFSCQYTAERHLPVLGLVVDSLRPMENIQARDVRSAGHWGGIEQRGDRRFLLGVAKVGNQDIALLDVNRVMRSD